MTLQEELQQEFRYDEVKGVFIRKRFGRAVPLNISRKGYPRVSFQNKIWEAHRLAWLYIFGTLPKEIDHVDRNPRNYAISNLRETTHSNNMLNTDIYSNNTSGYKGVCKDKRSGKWYSRFREKFLGQFNTPEEAYAAYLNARQSYLGEAK